MSIENPGNELKANMTANAEIVLEERPNVLHRPRSRDRLRRRAQGVCRWSSIRRQRSGRRRRVPIKIGISNGTRTQVLEGLKAGDQSGAAE